MTALRRVAPVLAPRVSSSALGRPAANPTLPPVSRSRYGSSRHETIRDSQPATLVPWMRAYARRSAPCRRPGLTYRRLTSSPRMRPRRVSPAVALAVRASRPAAGTALALLELFPGATDPAFARRRLLGVLDPADEL